MGPKKTFEDIISETTIDDIEEPDATKYINLLKDKIVIDQFPLKIKIIITSEFATPIAFDRIESHYSHPAKVVLTQNNLSKFYDDLIDKFKAWVDQFQERGSGFDFNSIKSVQDKPILNKYEEDEFQEATECYICGKEFEENNKVREHDHLSGKDKKKYIVHYKVLKDYIKLGMKVTKVYKTISFKESDWLAKYINFNTEQRTKSKSDFEKDLWKLMNNSFYGKTLEDIRGRSEIKLLTDREEVKNYIKKPNFKDSTIFNDNFVAIENNVTSVKFNKPIYLGQAILDYSKQLMYDFYYNVVNKLWKKNELIASDTDSIFLNIKTEDIYEDMKKIEDELDTSGYPKDHPLYSEKNKKVIGKFKDELNGKIMHEIVYLRSKAYSFTFVDLNQIKEEKKLKGIGKTTITKDIKFDDYKDCLFNNKTKMNKCIQMNSKKHEMFVNEVNKISTNPFDDKRYIKDNGIDTLPFGF
ncbi:unnamed protein product [Mytilus coruscus]|uniref:DNA-directed DNA polymerase n=1 Tax=Mytilus coruscus TaxID=42192 RepID=A0A6J8EA46_MYTCO|nr:unnamed protein product [Mytilus coruscus]